MTDELAQAEERLADAQRKFEGDHRIRKHCGCLEDILEAAIEVGRLRVYAEQEDLYRHPPRLPWPPRAARATDAGVEVNIRGERVCLRCGADPKEERRLGDFGCRAWGVYHPKHLWGVVEPATDADSEEGAQ